MSDILFLLLPAITYFILFTGFLPFSLSIQQKILFFLLISISLYILFIFHFGNIAAVFLIALGCIYVCVLDKHYLLNICIIIGSYIFGVLYDYFFSFFTAILGFDYSHVQNSFPTQIVYVILLLLLVKGITSVIFKRLLIFPHVSFPKELRLALFLNLLICACIFILNIVALERTAYKNRVLIFNGILFVCYFFSTTIVILINIRSFINRLELQHKEETFQNLRNYTSQIEEMYTNIHDFKHDYVNVMTSMTGYLEQRDLDGLCEYFYKEILPSSRQITMSDFKLNQLINIKIPEVKALISSKLVFAHEMGITVDIEIRNTFDTLAIDPIDFIRILGVLLDNAIEAALETDEPWIAFTLIQQDHSTSILISNTFVDHGISYNDFQKTRVSSKGSGRGTGLHNVSKIISKYPKTIWESEKDGNHFTQKLEMAVYN